MLFMLLNHTRRFMILANQRKGYFPRNCFVGNGFGWNPGVLVVWRIVSVRTDVCDFFSFCISLIAVGIALNNLGIARMNYS